MTSRTRIGLVPLTIGSDAAFRFERYTTTALGEGWIAVTTENGSGRMVSQISFDDRQSMAALRDCLDKALNEGDE